MSLNSLLMGFDLQIQTYKRMRALEPCFNFKVTNLGQNPECSVTHKQNDKKIYKPLDKLSPYVYHCLWFCIKCWSIELTTTWWWKFWTSVFSPHFPYPLLRLHLHILPPISLHFLYPPLPHYTNLEAKQASTDSITAFVARRCSRASRPLFGPTQH